MTGKAESEVGRSIRRAEVYTSLLERRNALSESLLLRLPQIADSVTRKRVQELLDQKIPASIGRIKDSQAELDDRFSIEYAEICEREAKVHRREIHSLSCSISSQLHNPDPYREVRDNRRRADLVALERERKSNPILKVGYAITSRGSVKISSVRIELSKLHTIESVDENANELPKLLTAFSMRDFTRVRGTFLVDRSSTIRSLLRNPESPEAEKQVLNTQLFDFEKLLITSNLLDIYSPEQFQSLIDQFRRMISDPNLKQIFITNINDLIQEKGEQVDDLSDLGIQELASKLSTLMRNYSNLEKSGLLIQAKKVKHPKYGDVTSVYKAVFDIAARNIYEEAVPSIAEANSRIFAVNRELLNAWYEGSYDVIATLRTNPYFVEDIEYIEQVLGEFNLINPQNLSNDFEIDKTRDIQIKIRNSIRRLNNQILDNHPRTRYPEEIASEPKLADLPQEVKSREDLPGDAIPSLLPQLNHIESFHIHKYHSEATIGAKEAKALSTAEDLRTNEQKQLLEDIAYLRLYTTYENYKKVYTPDELRDLVIKLEMLSGKNREDFDIYEGQALTTMGLDKKTRLGWIALNNLARKASGVLRRKSIHNNFELSGYFIDDVNDPNSNSSPNLTRVYQFIVDDYAVYIHGKRSISTQKLREAAFVSNCEIIYKWVSDVEKNSSELIGDTEVASLSSNITEMIDAMNKRFKGEEVRGFNKDFQLNPVGAIRLQKRIGYAVEELKKHINLPAQSKTDDEQIIPLE